MASSISTAFILPPPAPISEGAADVGAAELAPSIKADLVFVAIPEKA
jgi:hypothetical protein